MSDSLPSGWALTNIGTLASYTNGRGFAKSEWKQSGLPIIRIQNLTDPGASFNYSDQQHEEKYRVQDGDLLVSWAATLGVYLWNRGPGWLNQHIFRVDVNRPIVIKPFLHYALQHALQALYAKTHGSGMVHITKGKFDAHPVKLPPANEQRRIVSKIDELFSRIDEGEQALKRVEKLVERYRQSVLKAAVTGELTWDWRAARKRAGEPVESGEALLARILKARRAAWEIAELAKLKAKGKPPADERWKQKYQEPAPPDTTDLPELPEGWVWATTEQLCFVETGATPKRGNARFYEGGTIDWITSAAVNDQLIVSAEERITEAAVEETNAKMFAAGSLIVAMYGEGKTRGKVSELGIPAATNQACAALLCGHLDAGVKAYVKVFLEKNYLALRSAAAGGVQPNLNLSIIKALPVALPSLPEQTVILSHVSKAASSTEVAAQGCTNEMRRTTALRQSILKAAFSGQLVPQDPHDEPASKLLERIAAERASTTDRPQHKTKRQAVNRS